jgi:hypothetical protein
MMGGPKETQALTVDRLGFQSIKEILSAIITKATLIVPL